MAVDAGREIPMEEFERVWILGVGIHNISTGQALSTIARWIDNRQKPRCVFTPNEDLIMKARRDDAFRRMLNNSDLAVPDGMAVVYASRVLGTALSGTVNGRLLARDLCQKAADRGWSVYFLGGRPGAAELAGKRMQQAHPALRVAGNHCPAFEFALGDEEDAKAVAAVRDARPDILFVALGSPKQEKWIAAHADAIMVPVSIGVGYAFDMLGGLVREPPGWTTRIGLEWLWRLAREPRRLWRRYLLEGMIFIGLVLKTRWKEGVGRGERERR